MNRKSPAVILAEKITDQNQQNKKNQTNKNWYKHVTDRHRTQYVYMRREVELRSELGYPVYSVLTTT